MRKLTLLFTFFALFTFSIKAQQNRIFLNVSALSQPEDFSNSIGFPGLKKYPVAQIDAGIQSTFGTSKWIYEALISYSYVESRMDFDDFDPSAPNDPLLPKDFSAKTINNLGGLKLGTGYIFSKLRKKHSLQISIGAKIHLSFASKSRYLSNNKVTGEFPSFRGEYFKYGILYGAYLKPTYQLAFSRNSPWTLNIFGEANLLWRNATDDGNPMLMAGLGLGVSYSLN